MKEQLKAMMEKIKDDATFIVRWYGNQGIEGTFRSEFETKPFLDTVIQELTSIRIHPTMDDLLVINEKLGVSIEEFFNSICYETPDCEGFEEYICKFNRYYNIFVKIDRDEHIITFKLGDKTAHVKLVEHTEWTHKYVASKKQLLIKSIDSFNSFINDPFWNPSIVVIGRRILKLKSPVALG
ncbi:hypothetical protein [Paenibacillus periandrae]|uniref:hypothetical protein n=1 Tax=Paenibacillus periandrae TaxID=1761741 RepID=UPI001F095E4E|nr:hypothetical protein [Paenibacillus periandrae]